MDLSALDRRILQTFRQYDRSGKGTISRAHLSQVLQYIGLDTDTIKHVLTEPHVTGEDVFYEDWYGWLVAHASPPRAASPWSPDGWRELGPIGATVKAYLAGANEANFFSVDIPGNVGRKEPKATGGFQAFLDAHPSIGSQAHNQIKACPNCKKPCAVTMSACNSCGNDLSETAVSQVPNLFIGFIFGIDKAGFPLKISLRTETPDIMVFDDPLALTRAHVLAVPTDVYIPDIRTLFKKPAEALVLLEKLDNAAWNALVQGPLSNDAWKRKALSALGSALPLEKLRKHVVAAFNLPPSQYQLHLQYMLLPLLPGHVAIFKRGSHFIKFRHFPLAYVRDALQALVDAKESLPKAKEMSADQLVEKLQQYGVDYDAAYAKDLRQLEASNTQMGNWDPADFSYAVTQTAVCAKDTCEPIEGGPAGPDLMGKDKLVLQGYGRPYGADGKPGGVYYSHARDPDPLPDF